MPSWPTGFRPLLSSYRETPPQTVIRTQMDKGPAKVRRQTTAGVRGISFSMLLTTTQAAALDSFFLSDAAGGAITFSFPYSRAGGTLSCRFVQPPEYVAASGNYYSVAVALEALP